LGKQLRHEVHHQPTAVLQALSWRRRDLGQVPPARSGLCLARSACGKDGACTARPHFLVCSCPRRADSDRIVLPRGLAWAVTPEGRCSSSAALGEISHAPVRLRRSEGFLLERPGKPCCARTVVPLQTAGAGAGRRGGAGISWSFVRSSSAFLQRLPKDLLGSQAGLSGTHRPGRDVPDDARRPTAAAGTPCVRVDRWESHFNVVAAGHQLLSSRSAPGPVARLGVGRASPSTVG